MPSRPLSLRSVQIFKELPAASLRRLENACQWLEIAADQPIVTHRARDRGACFLVRGRAIAVLQTVTGRTVEFGEIDAGQMFSELTAIDGLPSAITVVAKLDCVVARFEARAFRDLLEREPLLSIAVMRHLSARVRHLTARLFELSVLAVPARLQAELLRIALDGDVKGDTAVVHRLPTHSDLANRIATAREVVSREISRLDRDGIVERRGTTLRIPSLSRLDLMVRESLGHAEPQSSASSIIRTVAKSSSRPLSKPGKAAAPATRRKRAVTTKRNAKPPPRRR